MGSTLKMSLTLACFVVVFVFALDITYLNTKDEIARQDAAKKQNALLKVVAGADSFEEQTLSSGVVYYKGKNAAGETLGYAAIAAGKGYGGTIQTMVGFTAEGKVLAIQVLDLVETPGLGMRAKEIASTLTIWDVIAGRKKEGEPTDPWFELQFTGLDLKKPIKLKNPEVQDGSYAKDNAISNLTGATITSKAIADSVSGGLKDILTEIKGR